MKALEKLQQQHFAFRDNAGLIWDYFYDQNTTGDCEGLGEEENGNVCPSCNGTGEEDPLVAGYRAAARAVPVSITDRRSDRPRIINKTWIASIARMRPTSKRSGGAGD